MSTFFKTNCPTEDTSLILTWAYIGSEHSLMFDMQQRKITDNCLTVSDITNQDLEAL